MKNQITLERVLKNFLTGEESSLSLIKKQSCLYSTSPLCLRRKKENRWNLEKV